MARFRAYSPTSSDTSTDSEEGANGKTAPIKNPQKYAVVDSDSESDSGSTSSSAMQEDELLPVPKRRKKSHPISHSSSSDTSTDDEDSDENAQEKTVVNGATSRDRHLTSFAQSVGVDAKRMHVMQASMFRTQDNHPLNRKHSRDSEGLAGDKGMRTSFSQAVPHATTPQKPSRKYTRMADATPRPPLPIAAVPQARPAKRIQLPVPVAESQSIFRDQDGLDGVLVDAGLSHRRSFRVSWSRNGQLTSISNSKIKLKRCQPVPEPPDESDVLQYILLPHLLSHCPILPDEDGIPSAEISVQHPPDASVPSRGLNFSSFAALFSTESQKEEHRRTREIFKCGEALFDPLPKGAEKHPELARKRLFSKFLKTSILSSSAPAELLPTNSTAADHAFHLLTSHQISKAAHVALDGSYPRLATLLAHAGSTDALFRSEVSAQLQMWKDDKVLDDMIECGVKKCYALLSGDFDWILSLNVLDDACKNDWKRVFGMLMWYVLPLDASIADVYRVYVELYPSVPRPLPSHLSSDAEYEDPLFALVHLYAQPALSLGDVLHPLSFSTDPLDFGLPWVLYVLLARVFGVRDFCDRETVFSDENGMEVDNEGEDEGDADEGRQLGHSPSADLLTASLLAQLERRDALQEAVFIGLFGESGVGRKMVLKNLLARNAAGLEEWVTRGLIGSLKVPQGWVWEAKALYAHSQNRLYDAYELYLSAARCSPEDSKHNLSLAHTLSSQLLSPEAILRNDTDLLKSLFDPFASFAPETSVENWNVGGGLFLQYAKVLTRLPVLVQKDDAGRAVDDAAEAREREELERGAGRLLGLIPDVLASSSAAAKGKRADAEREEETRREAALKKMMKELVGLLSSSSSSKQTQVKLGMLAPADESTKMAFLREEAGRRFIRSVQSAAPGSYL